MPEAAEEGIAYVTRLAFSFEMIRKACNRQAMILVRVPVTHTWKY